MVGVTDAQPGAICLAIFTATVARCREDGQHPGNRIIMGVVRQGTVTERIGEVHPWAPNSALVTDVCERRCRAFFNAAQRER